MTLLKTSKLRSLCNKVTSVFMTNMPCGTKKKDGKSTKPESRQTGKKGKTLKGCMGDSQLCITSNPYQMPWGQEIVNIPAKR